MNRITLEDALEQISDTHITEAAASKRRKRHFWVGAAAAILALVTALHLLPKFVSDPLPAVHAGAISLSEGSRCASRDSDFDRWTQERKQREAILSDAREQLHWFFTRSCQTVLADAESNSVYSPANLYIALAMAAEMSQGQSRQQTLDVLGISDLTALRTQVGAIWETLYTEDSREKLVLANSLWLDDSLAFHQPAMEDLAYYHYASVYQYDLQSETAGRAIQTWLNENTGNLLRDAVESVEMEPDTLFALYSTIYFQSRWSAEFNPSGNTKGPFHGAGMSKYVTYMNRQRDSMHYYWGDSFGAVYLYLRNGSRMWFFLPDEGKTPEDVLAEGEYLELAMSDYQKDPWANQKYMLVNLSVPKFDISSQNTLTEDLQALGVRDLFDPANADLSGALQTPAWLTEVNQAVRVAIDENGVTAAAYTEMIAGAGMPPEEIMDFKLDRPFLFVIEKQSIPLFVGIINEP